MISLAIFKLSIVALGGGGFRVQWLTGDLCPPDVRNRHDARDRKEPVRR